MKAQERASCDDPLVLSKVIGVGKASSEDPLIVSKGKGKGRASGDNPWALLGKEEPAEGKQ